MKEKFIAAALSVLTVATGVLVVGAALYGVVALVHGYPVKGDVKAIVDNNVKTTVVWEVTEGEHVGNLHSFDYIDDGDMPYHVGYDIEKRMFDGFTADDPTDDAPLSIEVVWDALTK